jgi:hypothetical protein
MQINDNLQAMLPSPCYGGLQVRKLALDEWLARSNLKGPIADGESHMVKSADVSA